MVNKQKILQQLEDMYSVLDRKRTLTEYTPNEASNIAKAAIKLIQSWPEEGIEIVEAKAAALEMLTSSVAAADKYYNNYDFANRAPRPGATEPWRAVTDAQNGIEYFIAAVQEN